MKKIAYYLTTLAFLFLVVPVGAQGYHALNGSPYAGVLSNFTNPASAVNTPFKWDFSVLGFPSNTINNGIDIGNLKFAATNKNKTNVIQPTSGYMARQFDNNADLHLLNFRIKIDDQSCFSFGFRIRTYNRITASPFNYTDTISWSETNFSYSKILRDYDGYRLSGGVTLGILRGLSGVYGGANNMSYREVSKNGNAWLSRSNIS